MPSQPIAIMSSAVSLLNNAFYWTRLVLNQDTCNQCCAYSFVRNWQLLFLNQLKGVNDRRKYSMINLHEKILSILSRPSNPQLPDHQTDAHPTEPKRPALDVLANDVLENLRSKISEEPFKLGPWNFVCSFKQICYWPLLILMNFGLHMSELCSFSNLAFCIDKRIDES